MGLYISVAISLTKIPPVLLRPFALGHPVVLRLRVIPLGLEHLISYTVMKAYIFIRVSPWDCFLSVKWPTTRDRVSYFLTVLNPHYPLPAIHVLSPLL
jgi:hypothetical protein